MLKNLRKSESGFTLIELLIVVAIIGILAAIAIPQFAAYRIRGYNSAANSDARNIGTAEEALFADSQGYGTIEATANGAVLAPAAAAAAAAIQAGPLNGATTANAGAFIFNALGAVPFSISNGVSVGSTLTVTAVAPVIGTSYVVEAKHLQGDSCFGRDSDSTSMYKAIHAAGPATALLAADIPASTANADDLGTAAAINAAGCGIFNVM